MTHKGGKHVHCEHMRRVYVSRYIRQQIGRTAVYNELCSLKMTKTCITLTVANTSNATITPHHPFCRVWIPHHLFISPLVTVPTLSSDHPTALRSYSLLFVGSSCAFTCEQGDWYSHPFSRKQSNPHEQDPTASGLKEDQARF